MDKQLYYTEEMQMPQINTRLVLRNDTKANWETVKNTATLKVGEFGVDSDTGLFKIGKEITVDGTTRLATWEELDYATDSVTNNVKVEASLAALGTGRVVGDMGIVKEPLYEGATEYVHTAYVWNGSDWAAMDGNYTADNVYFSDDLSTTYEVGNILLTDGSATIASKGKNLKQVWDTIYLKESKTVTIKNPTLNNMSKTGGTDSGTSVETGTSFTRPKVKVTVSSTGEYGNGSKELDGTSYLKAAGTGVSFTQIKIGAGTVNKNTTSSVTIVDNGTSAEYQATETDIPSTIVTDGDTSYGFSAWASYSASDRYPVTNLGNYITGGSLNGNTFTVTATSPSPYDSDGKTVIAKGKIAEGSLTKSLTWKITGYRSFFYGWVTKELSDLTSDDIRGLTNGGNYNSGKTITIKASTKPDSNPDKITYFIVAIPESNTRAGITHADSTSGMTVDVTDSWYKADDTANNFRLPRVEVADAQTSNGVNAGKNKKSYKICYWTSATIGSDTVHQITLG
jgi:hypothetical protein